MDTRRGVRANDIILVDAPAAPRFRLPRPEFDTRRFRHLVRRKPRRGYLVGVAVTAATVAAAAALTSLAAGGHGVNGPRDNAPAPNSASAAAFGRSETGPSTTSPSPCPRIVALPQPATGGEPRGHAAEATGALPRVPPRKPRRVPRPAPLDAAPAKPPSLDATSAKLVEFGATSAKPVQLDAAPAKPTLGELDREIVLRHIGYHLDRIRHCYEARRIAKPDLAGKVLARFDVTPAGSVASSTALGLDTAVASCVADDIKDIEFPRSGAGVHVNYVFQFQPA